MKVVATCLSGLFLLCSCASVRPSYSDMGNGSYLVSCNGNGYASLTETIQCVAKEAKNICDKQGKGLQMGQINSDSGWTTRPNLANGQMILMTRPQAMVQVQCVDQVPPRYAKAGATEAQFLRDRYACLKKAEPTRVTAAVDSGSVSLRPSCPLLFGCLAAKGYIQSKAGALTVPHGAEVMCSRQ